MKSLHKVTTCCICALRSLADNEGPLGCAGSGSRPRTRSCRNCGCCGPDSSSSASMSSGRSAASSCICRARRRTSRRGGAAPLLPGRQQPSCQPSPRRRTRRVRHRPRAAAQTPASLATSHVRNLFSGNRCRRGRSGRRTGRTQEVGRPRCRSSASTASPEPPASAGAAGVRGPNRPSGVPASSPRCCRRVLRSSGCGRLLLQARGGSRWLRRPLLAPTRPRGASAPQR